MSFVGNLVSKFTGATKAADAAEKAADVQGQASLDQISEQRRQFDAFKELLSPYVAAGNKGLSAQSDLIGLNGNVAQQNSIDQIKAGPQFQSMLKTGEDSILSNASATGGLRGGNTQSALAQFSPQLLSQLLNEQFTKLGGFTSLGQNSAAGVGNAGMQTGQLVSGSIGEGAAAKAGGILAQGGIQRQGVSDLMSILGAVGGFMNGSGKNSFGGFSDTGGSVPANQQPATSYFGGLKGAF